MFVSYRGRVTKVAPECLRKASVSEEMSWDITTQETLRGENISSVEPVLDEAGEFLDTENARHSGKNRPISKRTLPP